MCSHLSSDLRESQDRVESWLGADAPICPLPCNDAKGQYRPSMSSNKPFYYNIAVKLSFALNNTFQKIV